MWGLKEQLLQDLPDPYFGEIRFATAAKLKFPANSSGIVIPLSRYGCKYILIRNISFVPLGSLQRIDLLADGNIPLMSFTDTQAIAPIQNPNFLLKTQTLRLTLIPLGGFQTPIFSVSYQWISHKAPRNPDKDPKAP